MKNGERNGEKKQEKNFHQKNFLLIMLVEEKSEEVELEIADVGCMGALCLS